MSAIHRMTDKYGREHQALEEHHAEVQAAKRRIVQKEAVEMYRLGYADAQRNSKRRPVEK